MSRPVQEQRNAYKGSPERPWVRLRLVDDRAGARDVELLADTGNPCAVILGEQLMQQFRRGDGPDVQTNFGLLEGGWLYVLVPELGLGEFVLGYASDSVVVAARESCPDFEGLVGLPLLRLVEYGGDRNSFWLRR